MSNCSSAAIAAGTLVHRRGSAASVASCGEVQRVHGDGFMTVLLCTGREIEARIAAFERLGPGSLHQRAGVALMLTAR